MSNECVRNHSGKRGGMRETKRHLLSKRSITEEQTPTDKKSCGNEAIAEVNLQVKDL
jgi:hypothetical protein